MMISHRTISGPAPVAQKNFYQSSSPSIRQSQNRQDQVLELRQQIQTTNPYDKYRLQQLQRKLKQLERPYGLTSAKGTPSSSTSDYSPPTTIPSPIVRSKSTLNPSAPEWSPLCAPITAQKASRYVLKPTTTFLAALPAPFPAPIPPSSIVDAKIIRFAIPPLAEHIAHEKHKWGPGGLNPYTFKLLSSSLLDAINEIGDVTPSSYDFDSFDHDDVSELDLDSPESRRS